MERRYELKAIDFLVGAGETIRTMPAEMANDFARMALISADEEGNFQVGNIKGLVKKIKAYDNSQEREIEIPFQEFYENATSERMRISPGKEIGALIDRSQMYQDLCMTSKKWD